MTLLQKEKALHSGKGCVCEAGFKPRVCRIINEFPGQAKGYQTVYWTVLISPCFLLPHSGPLLGPHHRPQVGIGTGPYLAAGVVCVHSWRFVLV